MEYWNFYEIKEVNIGVMEEKKENKPIIKFVYLAK